MPREGIPPLWLSVWRKQKRMRRRPASLRHGRPGQSAGLPGGQWGCPFFSKPLNIPQPEYCWGRTAFPPNPGQRGLGKTDLGKNSGGAPGFWLSERTCLGAAAFVAHPHTLPVLAPKQGQAGRAGINPRIRCQSTGCPRPPDGLKGRLHRRQNRLRCLWQNRPAVPAPGPRRHGGPLKRAYVCHKWQARPSGQNPHSLLQRYNPPRSGSGVLLSDKHGPCGKGYILQ